MRVAKVFTTVLAFVSLGLSAPVFAQARFALIVSGAAGGQTYADQYGKWTTALNNVLIDRMKMDRDKITILKDGQDPATASTAENVKLTLTVIRRQMGKDDVLFVMLIGHGTFDGIDAKFNLVGPDLESADWGTLLDGLPGRVVIVNTTPASFPFLERLAGPRRVVISATDTAAQRFDTVFPEYFIKALQSDAADLDKNGRISIWEAFAAAADGVRRYYQQRGQLATERPLLDDNGDGVGHEATGTSDDGPASSRVYLDQELPGAAPTDEVLLQLLLKRAALESEIEDLRIRKAFMAPADYQKEFERLMVELAKVGRDIRMRVKS